MLQMVRSLCLCAAALFLVMATLALFVPCTSAPLPPILERYDPSLANIRSVRAAEEYVRAQLPAHAAPAQIAAAIEDFAARRFLHGFSSYSVCDNWLAYVAGGFWYNLRVPIDADDVLKHRVAMCTQNTTVVQALLERFDIPTASAVFRKDKHIAPLALIDGRWALYDGDLEPLREGVVFLDDFHNVAKHMYGARASQLEGKDFASLFQAAANEGQIRVASPTRASSTKGRLFQRVTWFMSWFGWAVFLVLAWAAGWMSARRAAAGNKRVTQSLLQREPLAGMQRPESPA